MTDRIQKITAAAVEEPGPGLFSNCLVAGGFVFVSGQHAGGPDGAVGGDDMAAQAREAFRRVLALLEAAGCQSADVVKLTVFIKDIARRAAVSAVRKEFFADPFPCSTLVEVSGLAFPDLLVEIEAMALAPESRRHQP